MADDGLVCGEDGIARCWWGASAPEYRAYHDIEWGHPVADDVRLFEKLSLEGFQAGLSWLTILRRREAFRRVFAGFEFERMARFDQGDVDRLVADATIIRHRGKIEAVVNNARRALELVGGRARWPPMCGGSNRRRGSLDLTARASPSSLKKAQSQALAPDLKRRGWRFVGPTTVYAFMQAMGLVNNHLAGCPAGDEVDRARAGFERPHAGSIERWF